MAIFLPYDVKDILLLNPNLRAKIRPVLDMVNYIISFQESFASGIELKNFDTTTDFEENVLLTELHIIFPEYDFIIRDNKLFKKG